MSKPKIKTKGIDKAEAEYLQKLTEKTIQKSDGKIPVKMLYADDYLKFNGVNLQGHAQNPPTPEQGTLALYMIDLDRQLSKRFTITQAMLALMMRKTERIIYGTTDPEGHQTKFILQWEKEIRLYPDKLHPDIIPEGDKRSEAKERTNSN